MTAKCFFCHQPIQGKAENHHRICRRYFRKGSDHRKGNIVKVHPECHRRFHFEVENPRWKFWQFKKEMEPIKFGEGVFAD